jgi:hypothetical protein
MHQFLHAHYGEMLLVLGVALFVAIANVVAKLSTIVMQQRLLLEQLNIVKGLPAYLRAHELVLDSLKESVLHIEALGESSRVELHAMAAHFVPRLRTKEDIEEQQTYEEESAMGVDPESEFYTEQDKHEKGRS